MSFDEQVRSSTRRGDACVRIEGLPARTQNDSSVLKVEQGYGMCQQVWV